MKYLFGFDENAGRIFSVKRAQMYLRSSTLIIPFMVNDKCQSSSQSILLQISEKHIKYGEYFLKIKLVSDSLENTIVAYN